jgi:hypothetical protein
MLCPLGTAIRVAFRQDCPKLLPDHVYFTDDSEYWLMERKSNHRHIGIYNLEDESSKDVVSPQLWLNWPNPIWITQVS